MSFIRTEARGHVLLITLARPEARNAFTRAMALEMEAVVDRFDADPAMRAAVLCAEGPSFCAGQDLKAAAAGELAISERRGGFGLMQQPPAKPLIAAVEGQALAGGMELTLCCDLIVASSSAVFGLAEVKRSLVATGGACFRLVQRLPYPMAMEILLTGLTKTAQQMHALGYVNRVVEPGSALTAALELADTIAANGPLAVRATKGIAWAALTQNWTDAEGWKRQNAFVEPVLRSADLAEGLRAFAEKRAPMWTGA